MLRRPKDSLLRMTGNTELQRAYGGKNFEILHGRVGRQQDRFENGARDGFWRHHALARGLGPESFPDVSVGGAGQQSDNADAARTEFFAESIGEAEGGVLGSIVGGRSGEDASGGDGQIVHDGGAGFHDRKCGLRDQERAVDVGCEHIFPNREWKFLDGQAGLGDAGVVDGDIELWKLATNGAEEIVDRVGVADIAGVVEDTNFVTEQFPADSGQGFLVTTGDDQIGGFGGEGAGDRESDTAGGAGDERGATAEAGGMLGRWRQEIITLPPPGRRRYEDGDILARKGSQVCSLINNFRRGALPKKRKAADKKCSAHAITRRLDADG